MFARAFNSPKVTWNTLPKKSRSKTSPKAVLCKHTFPPEADGRLSLVVKELLGDSKEGDIVSDEMEVAGGQSQAGFQKFVLLQSS